MKKILSAILVLAMLACSVMTFASCEEKIEKEDVPGNTKWEFNDIQNIERDGEPVDPVLLSINYEVLKRLYGEYTYKKDSKGYIVETQFHADRIEFKDGKAYYHEIVGKYDGEEYNSATVYSMVDTTVTECGTYEGSEISLTLSECNEAYFTDGKLIIKAKFTSSSSDSITTADLVFTRVGALL